MTNEVFAALFQAGGKALRAWDPARGRTLESFVSLLARHQALSILRSGKTSPWPDEPTDDEQLETLCRTSMSAEEIVSSREELHLLLDRAGATAMAATDTYARRHRYLTTKGVPIRPLPSR